MNFKCLNCGNSLSISDNSFRELICLNDSCFPITNHYNSYILKGHGCEIGEYSFTLRIRDSYFRINSTIKYNRTIIFHFYEHYIEKFSVGKYFPITFDNYAQEVPKILNQLLKLSAFV